jgi:hypothetical protein
MYLSLSPAIQGNILIKNHAYNIVSWFLYSLSKCFFLAHKLAYFKRIPFIMSMYNLIKFEFVTRYSYPAIPLNLAIGFDFLLSKAGKLKFLLTGVTYVLFWTFIFVS